MTTLRVEIRLDPEQRRKLDDIAKRNQVSISDIVRRLIDQEYEEELRQRRIAAVERMARMEVEDVPDPEELSRQLDETYSVGDLY
jgi:predicted transcriptional regulator